MELSSSCRLVVCWPAVFRRTGKVGHVAVPDYGCNIATNSPAWAGLLGKADKKLAFNDTVAGLAGHRGDDAVGGRRKAEHRLHRFQDHHDLAARDRHAGFGKDLRDLAGDRCNKPAACVVFLGRRRLSDRAGGSRRFRRCDAR